MATRCTSLNFPLICKSLVNHLRRAVINVVAIKTSDVFTSTFDDVAALIFRRLRRYLISRYNLEYKSRSRVATAVVVAVFIAAVVAVVVVKVKTHLLFRVETVVVFVC